MDDVEGLRWRSFVVVWWRLSLVEVFLNNGIVVSKVGKVIENKKKKHTWRRDVSNLRPTCCCCCSSSCRCQLVDDVPVVRDLENNIS